MIVIKVVTQLEYLCNVSWEVTYHKVLEALQMPLDYIFFSSADVNEKRIYYVFFLSSLALGLFVYLTSNRKEGFIRYFFNPKVWLTKSAFVDYLYIFFNAFVKVFLLGFIFKVDKYLAFYFQEELTTWFGYSTLTVNVAVFAIVFLVVLTIVEDFFSFLVHFLMHKIPFFWHFHKVHHSATVMNPITQYRIHPVELLLNNISYLIALGLVHGFFGYLFYEQAPQITSVTKNMFTFVFFLAGANLRHSHVKLTYFPWLEKILISPFQHQIHHSDKAEHFNKNMGSKFALWDLMFGTLILSKNSGKIKFGIGEEGKDFSSFLETLYRPFIKIFKRTK